MTRPNIGFPFTIDHHLPCSLPLSYPHCWVGGHSQVLHINSGSLGHPVSANVQARRACKDAEIAPNDVSSKLNKNVVEYQPSGAGGTRSPPATPQRLQHLTPA